jgi:hypothetical protein
MNWEVFPNTSFEREAARLAEQKSRDFLDLMKRHDDRRLMKALDRAAGVAFDTKMVPTEWPLAA